MAVQYSVAVRNARADAIEATIGTAPKLQLRSGAPPSNCAAADSGLLLAEFVLPSDWMTTAASGQKTMNAVTPVAAVASGTVAHYRIKDSTGATCHEQGTAGVAASGPDLVVDNPAVVAGQTVSITGWTIVEAGA
ncbi:Cytochrome c family protein (plasmid) [Rhodovastum atsumiense]|uniref:Uncharacterized protein n=1 Tax=Rhodovastum atsumiense TaxID=504468 RepID=A0A5M6IQ21_9PROT|nr:hypothetical protein [Rhodovastum atsumiense]KAA5609658.1 hypothetical protein F1189_23125 [Rhodovastum atsumiense]CAH2606417.1 Cytochrome c family protein [Rhodovastum atsumiense]